MKINAELHSIISIISVQKFPTLKQEDLFNKQIAFANKIFMTFIDKSTPEQILELEEEIKKENQDCCIAR